MEKTAMSRELLIVFNILHIIGTSIYEHIYLRLEQQA